MVIVPQETNQFAPETPEVEAWDAKRMEYMGSQQNERRKLNDRIEPGSVDIHIHFGNIKISKILGATIFIAYFFLRASYDVDSPCVVKPWCRTSHQIL